VHHTVENVAASRHSSQGEWRTNGLEATGTARPRLDERGGFSNCRNHQAPDGTYAGCRAPCKRAVISFSMARQPQFCFRVWSENSIRLRGVPLPSEPRDANSSMIQEVLAIDRFSKIAPTVFLK
jgi:hypothetical protein